MNLFSKVVLAGALALSLTGLAQAADMMPLPATDAAYDQQPQELGTNWYLRGDISAEFPGSNKMFDNAANSPLQNSYSVGLGAGYDFGDYRLDVTADYFQKEATNALIGAVTCGTADSCTEYDNYSKKNFLVLFNGYFNLGNWNGLVPYVGAGIGANVNMGHTDPRYWCVAGAGSCAPYSDGWNTIISSRDQTWNPAFALMTGVSYNMNDNFAIDLGYRFTTIYRGDVVGTERRNHYENQIRLGFRYKVD